MGTYTSRLKLSNPSAGECNWDDDWYRNQYIRDALAGQELQDNHIISGGILSGASGLNINISTVIGSIAGVEYTDAGGTLVLTAAAAGEELANWVYMDNTGNVLVSSVPITDTDYALIGVIDTNTANVVRQSDLRRIKDVVISSPIENDCINGTFNVWQRGTSQTTLSGYGSDDRWQNLHNGSTKNHTLQLFTKGQTDVPGNPKNYSRIIVTTVAGSGNFVLKRYRILDVLKYSGKTVCFKFHGKADSPKNISIEGVQNFGSGGSTEIDGIGITKISLTATWNKNKLFISFPSVTGKTIGSLSYTEFNIWFDAGSTYDIRTDTLGQQSGIFDLSEVEIYISDKELPVRRRTEEEELYLCQAYFLKSYNRDKYAGDSSSLGSILTMAYSGSGAIGLRFPTSMIRTPSVVLYPATGGAAGYVISSVGTVEAFLNGIGQNGGSFVSAVNVNDFVAGNYVYYHYTANSEI